MAFLRTRRYNQIQRKQLERTVKVCIKIYERSWKKPLLYIMRKKSYGCWIILVIHKRKSVMS